MYAKQPSDEELAAVGLKREDFAQDSVELWGENYPSVQVFSSMGTQWRMGFSGPVGLDYGVLPWVMRQEGIPPIDRQKVFADIRIMERAALNEMHKAG